MSTPADASLARLEGIAASGDFVTAPDELAQYEIDGVAPRAGIRASSADQVVEILRAAFSERLAVIPVGNATQLGVGSPPARYDVALVLSKLSQRLGYDPGDLTLTAGAGMTIGMLSLELQKHGQFLPLDSLAGDFATVGGILATNSSGPLRHAYGTARDFVLGLDYVNGEGARTKSGGRVVKSVAGYDIHKLHIGALGSLGVILSANFKTFPLPATQATFVVRFAEADGALKLRAAVAASDLQPRAFDMVSPEAARFLRHTDAAKADHLDVPDVDWEDTRKYVGEEKAAEYKKKYDEAAALAQESIAQAKSAPLFSEKYWTVLIAAGGNERVVERHCRDLEALAEQAGAASFSEARPEDSPEGCEEWRWIRSFPDCARRTSPAAAILKVTVLPSAFAAVISATKRSAEQNDVPIAAMVRAAGVVSCAVTPRENDDAAITELAAVCEEIIAAARKAGGSAVIELCPPALKRKMNIWGVPRGDIELMRRLKKEFDPAGILAPGRMMGL